MLPEPDAGVFDLAAAEREGPGPGDPVDVRAAGRGGDAAAGDGPAAADVVEDGLHDLRLARRGLGLLLLALVPRRLDLLWPLRTMTRKWP